MIENARWNIAIGFEITLCFIFLLAIDLHLHTQRLHIGVWFDQHVIIDTTANKVQEIFHIQSFFTINLNNDIVIIFDKLPRHKPLLLFYNLSNLIIVIMSIHDLIRIVNTLQFATNVIGKYINTIFEIIFFARHLKHSMGNILFRQAVVHDQSLDKIIVNGTTMNSIV